MKKVLIATCTLRDRWIVVFERVYTSSSFFMKSAVYGRSRRRLVFRGEPGGHVRRPPRSVPRFYEWWMFRTKLVYRVPWGARSEIIWCLHKKLVAGHYFLAPASILVAGVAWWKAIIQKFSRALNNHLALYWNISIVKYKTYFHL